MSNPSAAKSGTFQIGGSLPVHRLGFGAMRITGKGIWGPPADVAEAERTLKRLSEIGIDFIDTANSYGPDVSEALIAKALHPYQQGLVIATKGGLTRPGPDQWVPRGDPAYLRECVMQSLKRLKLDTIALWQLHRIDPGVPREKQFEEIAKMQKEGLIQHVGLSEVSVEEIAAAQKFFTVATVQNLYNLVNRQSEAVLDFCEAQNIGFIPWFPLAAGSLANAGSLLQTIANKHQVSPSAIALAWVLKRSPVMLPIPGTSKVAHLDENTRGAEITLSDEDFKALDQQGQAEWKKSKKR